jgi:hypothetical protein
MGQAHGGNPMIVPIDVFYMERGGSTAMRRWLESQFISSSSIADPYTCKANKKRISQIKHDHIFYDQRVNWRHIVEPCSKIRVFMLRDIFNHTASLISYNKPNAGYPFDENFVEPWIRLARHFVGKGEWHGKHDILINYTEWFTNPEYRANLVLQLAQLDLSVKFNDTQLNICHSPSSFHGARQKPTRLPLFDRWRAIPSDKLCKYISRYPEAIELNRSIFGEHPLEQEIL